MRTTPEDIVQKVIALSARGHDVEEIVDYVKDNNYVIGKSTVFRIRKDHAPIIHDIQLAVRHNTSATATDIRQTTHRLIANKLSKSERHAALKEQLDWERAEGLIKDDEYRRRSAHLAKEISTSELVSINRAMTEELKQEVNPNVPSDPGGAGAVAGVILSALANGNSIELQRLILGGNNDQSDSTPA